MAVQGTPCPVAADSGSTDCPEQHSATTWAPPLSAAEHCLPALWLLSSPPEAVETDTQVPLAVGTGYTVPPQGPPWAGRAPPQARANSRVLSTFPAAVPPTPTVKAPGGAAQGLREVSPGCRAGFQAPSLAEGAAQPPPSAHTFLSSPCPGFRTESWPAPRVLY